MLKKLLLSKYSFHDFFDDFNVKRNKYAFYKSIINKTTNLNIDAVYSVKEANNSNAKIHYVNQIPPYINIVPVETYKSFKFNFYNGYLIDIKGFESLDAYMAHQFGSKSRSKIRTYIKRLETCFNISYKMYFGNIDKNDYEALFDVLEIMIERRFLERGDEHQAANDWAFYKEIFYQLILDKKASMFVIYDNDKPIDINLSYHYDKILINYIRAYDIDYSKFRLGYIDISKQLAWCFTNNYHIFDLCFGNLDYKRQWCNKVYTFENQILYYKKSLLNIIIGNIIIICYKLKVRIGKQDKLETNSNTTEINSDLKNEPLSFDYVALENFIKSNIHSEINIEDEAYAFLRKPVYDFLYLNFEFKNNITIFKVINEPNVFLIKGKNKASKIVITNDEK